MLGKILQLIEQNGTISPAVIASQLGTSPQLVEMMLEDLERRGYLRSILQPDACADSSCSGCPASGGCGVKPRVWQLNSPVKP